MRRSNGTPSRRCVNASPSIAHSPKCRIQTANFTRRWMHLFHSTVGRSFLVPHVFLSQTHMHLLCRRDIAILLRLSLTICFLVLWVFFIPSLFAAFAVCLSCVCARATTIAACATEMPIDLAPAKATTHIHTYDIASVVIRSDIFSLKRALNRYACVSAARRTQWIVEKVWMNSLNKSFVNGNSIHSI